MFPSILETPFFENSHRKLAIEFHEWASSEIPAIEESTLDETQKARAFVLAMGARGWLGIFKNDSSSGDSLDVRSICIAREVIAHYSGRADACFALQGLGSSPILLFGSEQQRQRYLPGVAEGNLLPAFALSEAQSGSDAGAVQTSAQRKGSQFVLNGSKTWIGNAGAADFYIVFARTGEAPGAKGVSAFIVDSNTPGFEVTEQFEVVTPCVIGSLSFKDCLIQQSQMLGNPGEGFKVAMAILDIYRASVGAAALGFAKRAFQETVEHCMNRRLFGQTLADFQATQMRLCDMATEIECSSLLVYRAAWTRDVLKRRITYESSLAKMVSTEYAQKTIDSAVQLFGGMGVKKGSIIERLYRDIRPLRIYEGATEIQKIIIAGQILKRWTAARSLE